MSSVDHSGNGQMPTNPYSLDAEDYENLAAIDRELGDSMEENNEEDDFIDEVEAELEAKGTSGYVPNGAYVPVGAMPQQNGVLSPHAAEFWFPECRNCSCCKGFRHGCSCCRDGVNTCTIPTCVDTDYSAQVKQTLESRTSAVNDSNPNRISIPVITRNASNDSNRSQGKPVLAGGAAANELCKFENSPGGCRFGAGCRYKHMNGPSSPSNVIYQGNPVPSQIQCIYYARGNCQYGDACRYYHA